MGVAGSAPRELPGGRFSDSGCPLPEGSLPPLGGLLPSHPDLPPEPRTQGRHSGRHIVNLIHAPMCPPARLGPHLHINKVSAGNTITRRRKADVLREGESGPLRFLQE